MSLGIAPALAADLERLRKEFGPEVLRSDPLRFVHGRASGPETELAAFVASALAFGSVAGIFRSLDAVTARLGPRLLVAASAGVGALERALRGFRHRWVEGRDLAAGLAFVAERLEQDGSLEALFRDREPDFRGGIARLGERARRFRAARRTLGFRFLFSAPDTGACKRANLFLRWMVRRADGVDLGLYTELSPARLTIPLDTHLAFLGRALGLTRRATPDWAMAAEITDALRALDPDDPVKYDWALCRLGILDRCPKHRDPERCPECPLYRHCRLGSPRRVARPRGKKASGRAADA